MTTASPVAPVPGSKAPASADSDADPSSTAWTRKHLLGLEELSREEILAILDTAESFAEISNRSRKKVPALQGRIVFNLFFENSTRTRTSFSLAAKRLSADTQDFTASVSSLSKGETFIDTAKNIEAMGADVMVVRHPTPGAPHLLSQHVSSSIINAGDGAHEHPTQGLLDLMTIRKAKGRIEGLTVGLVGDIAHSRVARSNIWGLLKLGAKVILCGPPTLVPRAMERLGCEVAYRLEDVLPRCDVVNVLRIQFERQQGGMFPSVGEYSQFYMMNQERVRMAKPDLLLLAPGPINRGVELTPEVADGPHSAILDQVKNGLAVRMAVLYLLSGKMDARVSSAE
ncbi:MAG: aspartate carbamoyltransferase catalytic subunit [Paludisphaera borealis]|uniref:aspartate carbamoyltransferase catalytic subunit n=1 Tax=Paludisphaera borealis TaxID=1387353 RepID=UPI00283B38D3|nr:aspartate carbamoyltransferase catalytic subunit [Paludisphaera borealis]MDR3623109.1 aspartate carbamoyltransferase catalytic subunit [Paludisphaera borealis]